MFGLTILAFGTQVQCLSELDTRSKRLSPIGTGLELYTIDWAYQHLF